MTIKKSLESKDVAIQVEFLISIKQIFDNFMTKSSLSCALINALPEEKRRKTTLSMKCFYKAIIKYLQKMLPMDDVLLEALRCLNPREQKSANGCEYGVTIARELHSV